MQQAEIFAQHRALTALGRKYLNCYVAMVGTKVLRMGRDQRQVLDKARKMVSKGTVIGLYYLPGKKRHLYLLKTSSVHPL
jgi:hypothetical protein